MPGHILGSDIAGITKRIVGDRSGSDPEARKAGRYRNCSIFAQKTSIQLPNYCFSYSYIIQSPLLVVSHALELPYRKVYALKIGFLNLLSSRSRHQPVQPVLMPHEHHVRFVTR